MISPSAVTAKLKSSIASIVTVSEVSASHGFGTEASPSTTHAWQYFPTTRAILEATSFYEMKWKEYIFQKIYSFI